MSKNPAWQTYNETIRKVNDAYDKTMKPLRVALSEDLAETEATFDRKINPLLTEKRKAVEKLKTAFSDAADEATTKRNDEVRRARVVLNAEIEGRKKEPETAPA